MPSAPCTDSGLPARNTPRGHGTPKVWPSESGGVASSIQRTGVSGMAPPRALVAACAAPGSSAVALAINPAFRLSRRLIPALISMLLSLFMLFKSW